MRATARGRLVLAAALSALPLGFVWSVTSGISSMGTYLPGYCYSDGYCDPDTYKPGIFVPGSTTLVSESPIRVFLVFGALALALAASPGRQPHRWARAGVLCLAAAALLTAARGDVPVLVCLIAALALSFDFGGLVHRRVD